MGDTNFREKSKHYLASFSNLWKSFLYFCFVGVHDIFLFILLHKLIAIV